MRLKFSLWHFRIFIPVQLKIFMKPKKKGADATRMTKE
jgi:hypothetical protein